MSNVARRITVQEAQLRTAAVEIRSLVINGKQMTLSVFRQIQQEPVIDEENGQLNGIVWGKVNYFWGECKPNHLHIVWQAGDELRRACVYEDWDQEIAEHYRVRIMAYQRALQKGAYLIALLHTLDHLDDEPTTENFRVEWGPFAIVLTPDMMPAVSAWRHRKDEGNWWWSWQNIFDPEQKTYVRESAEARAARGAEQDKKLKATLASEVARLRNELGLAWPGMSAAARRTDVMRQLEQKVHERSALVLTRTEILEARQQSYETIMLADHLFIAV